jgi:hypothetical protein
MRIEYPVSVEEVVAEASDRLKKASEEKFKKGVHSFGELSGNGIDYEEPWCCGSKMLPQFTSKDAVGNLHRAFICCVRRRKKSVQVTKEAE